MGNEGYKIRDQSKPHFVTFTIVNWVDVFTRKTYKDLIVQSLNYCIANKGLVVYAYVIMSNHIHLVLQSKEAELSNLIRDFKKFTSKAIIEELKSTQESRRDWVLNIFDKAKTPHSRNQNYQVWKYGNHPEEIYSTKFLWTKLDYIHLNPVRAGIVKRASEYIYSSAKNYVEGEGLVNVNCVDAPIINTQKDDSFWKSIVW